MYIFLDIDGVLVKEDAPGQLIDLEEDLLKFDPDCLTHFETIVRKYRRCRIVISSAWREIFSLDTIKSCFSKDVAERVIGVTPIASKPIKHFRYFEVLDYLKQHDLEQASWIAIDDIPEHFPKTAPVIITDPYQGFDLKDAQNLEEWLKG